MKKFSLFFCLSLCVCLLETNAQETTFVSSDVQPYVDFLNQPHPTPVDYVMGLFERYDVVILGERHHSELTQYDLVTQIISDPRFIAAGGHVMTEVGSHNYTDKVNEVLCGSYTDENEFDHALIGILRNCEEQVLWPRTNFWNLLKTIRRINLHAPAGRRVDITFLNPSWEWHGTETMTNEEFKVMERALDYDNYDIIMGENAINTLYKIFESPRKKTLVILNVPHHLKYSKHWGYTAAACIMARFPGRVANVKINACMWQYHRDDTAASLPAVDGKWDAAFAAIGNKSMGFDLPGSPFGEDGYDGYAENKPEVRSEVTYGDMFNGYIFYVPFAETKNGWGIPGLVDDRFLPEMLRRFRMRGVSEDRLRRYYGDNIPEGINKVVVAPAFSDDTQRCLFDSIVSSHFIVR